MIENARLAEVAYVQSQFAQENTQSRDPREYWDELVERLRFHGPVRPETLAGHWVATGYGDEFAICVLDAKHVEGLGPWFEEPTAGTQVVNSDGTLLWKLDQSEFRLKHAGDYAVAYVQTGVFSRVIFLRRLDQNQLTIAFEGFDRVNRALQQAAGGDAAPVPVKRAPPTYPFDMKRAGIKGKVTVQFVISSNGQVTDASVLESTNPSFSATAVAAARQWIYRPGIKRGKPVVTLMSQTLSFNISH